MRADMFKVIVERPRWGASHAQSVKLKRSLEPDRKSIGLKRDVKINAPYFKGLNENLAPLVRFLRSRRGRRWDTGSTVKMHVRQHLDDFVYSRISIGRKGEWMFEGEVIGTRRWSRRRMFFVDPRDGILKDISELPQHARIPDGKDGAR